MKKITSMAIALLWSTSISAQEISFNSRAIENPVVNADHTVSFQFYAPNAANVTISGDFLPQEIRETPFGNKYTFVESDGGHTWHNWRHYLTQFVPLLFK